MPDEAEICGCNGVCKGAIVAAIEEHDLTTLDAVRARTKASSSCGSCTGLVEQVMTLTLGERYAPAAVTPMCGCTHLGHDEVRRLIRARELRTIPAVMQALEWTSSGGCAKCRPALNYYLVSDWPEEYEDDYQSRFINERAHANIQKDGTYSVVPRMWGGMTTAAELRAIADVVDRYEIPAVKVTGGQRIDMLGVSKENLPLVWADLGDAGFVSGHAYAKGLRTVKTCVGKTWCRFGTQDSTGLGIRLERHLWGSWTPAKVKLAVSGCPRNCAEATCKDIGVICVESGFDLHFAGAAGLDIKGTELLGHVETEDQVVEHVAALLQMYREQGHYLERIYKWARRVGLDEIRHQVMEDEARRTHWRERFEASQRIAQVDPWAERAHGRVAAHEFTPLTPAPPAPHEPHEFARGARGATHRTVGRAGSERQPIAPRDGACRHERCGVRERRRALARRRGARRHPAPRCARTLDHAGTRIAVFRTADDRLFALEDRCPHRGGPLSQGIVHGDCVTCPLHNLVVSLASGAAGEEGATRPRAPCGSTAGAVLLDVACAESAVG